MGAGARGAGAGRGWGRPSAELSARPQKMVESQRQNVLAEFERLRRLLAEDERRLLRRLEDEELEVLPPLRDSAARLGQQSAQLAQLIAELEGRCQLPALGLLQVSAPRACTRVPVKGGAGSPGRVPLVGPRLCSWVLRGGHRSRTAGARSRSGRPAWRVASRVHGSPGWLQRFGSAVWRRKPGRCPVGALHQPRVARTLGLAPDPWPQAGARTLCALCASQGTSRGGGPPESQS